MAAVRSTGSGTTAGLLVKIAVLSLSAAVAVWALMPLIGARDWVGTAIVVAATAALFYVYLSPRRLAAKYLFPGTLLLLAFQVVPVLITVSTATTNFGDGHRGDKADTIAFVEAASVEQVDGSPTYTLTPAVNSSSGELTFLLSDAKGRAYSGDREGLSTLDADRVRRVGDKIVSAKGFRVLSATQIASRDAEISGLAVPTGHGKGIRASGISTAYEGRATRVYHSDCDCVTDVKTHHRWTADNAKGRFVDAHGKALAQGWRVNIGASNFVKVLTDPSVRGPFLGILVWDLVFAVASVLLTFALGLVCALALNHPKLRARKLYRAAIVLPYAMPAFGMLLVWRDMFNADYGLLNSLLGLHIEWFGHTTSARAAVILINLWLGFPYMFLITTGALQAIPQDSMDAATVDGASAGQRFRKVTLPLILIALTPLLISSFALNFNNFNVIQLTTAGAPFNSGSAAAGGTDLLITYTYSLAFGGGGADYGFAAAISVFIFLIVAVISAISFRTTRRHEEVYR
ncbi:MAG TPA: ABC transporter permease subunit [Stackebrandtia sp.]|jgi:arabinogalactan oligomer/maltooligosaccharide transport system permease protein|uniref:ABC transporter permease subunit n=1 Tax=Stackebrandtia sp. TaxID=2023065 RepID=UPI002D3930B4|nr:ABC transporter permease subunit [Stackebrandtia sp.]HZE37921.1 ABC transporter permease subunit [Stackebrandtia sp.]